MQNGWNTLITSARIKQETVTEAPVCLLMARANTKELISKQTKIIQQYNAFLEESDSKLDKIDVASITKPTKTNTIYGKYITFLNNFLITFHRFCACCCTNSFG